MPFLSLAPILISSYRFKNPAIRLIILNSIKPLIWPGPASSVVEHWLHIIVSSGDPTSISANTMSFLRAIK